jgi:predicted DNA binding CopG/RHH family protein
MKMRTKKYKKIPEFKSQSSEAKFWNKNDTTDYIDWDNAKLAIFPNLKPSTKTISIRLPEPLLDSLKELSNKRDVPYQSYIKMILSDRVQKELIGSH